MVFNANNAETQVKIPAGKYVALVANGEVNSKPKAVTVAANGKYKVAALSTAVLLDAEKNSQTTLTPIPQFGSTSSSDQQSYSANSSDSKNGFASTDAVTTQEQSSGENSTSSQKLTADQKSKKAITKRGRMLSATGSNIAQVVVMCGILIAVAVLCLMRRKTR